MRRLAIVSTHPIQYNAPWFKLLTERGKVAVKIFYTWSQSEEGPKYDPDFKRIVEWDLPLLDGYDYEFVQNVATEPGSHHFKGIDNPTLIQRIENWKPDVMLVFGWAFKSHLRCLRYFKGKLPVLFRGDSTLLDETPGLKQFIRRLFLRWIYRHVDVALYTGTHNKAYFRAHGLKDSQLVQALHAIDNGRFLLDEERQLAARRLRQQLSISTNAFVVLFAGKLEEKKNPFFLLELAQRIRDPQFVFLMAGNGRLEERLKEAARNDERIKFLPFQNQTQMPVLYAAAEAFVLPSRGPNETWGLAANEAMATGLPVLLSSKTGGAVDLIHDNGLLFHPEDVETAVEYLQLLKANEAAYRNACQASLSHIKRFGYGQLAEAVETACNL